MSTKNNQTARPPVVVVMGHIDHGKSTLLDYIRKTNTTAKEAGGITQHLSAYEVEVPINNGSESRRMTFLDTPGHEAFCSIRERGAQIADIAVLVVSADDGVKPQTIEALKCIRTDAMPFIVAINKIDKNGVNVDKIKQNLAEHDVLVEGWGGSVPVVPISAKTGENIDELLEIIALQVDLEELKGESSLGAEGFVIESNLNPKQGISATLIIKNGTLKIGSFVASDSCYAPVRTIENFMGSQIKEATFSSPVKITGWNNLPIVGRNFKTFDSKDGAMEYAQKTTIKPTNENNLTVPSGCACLTLIVKADTTGSLEAVEHELGKLDNEKIVVRIISKGVGPIIESDIKTAGIKKSLVLGFNVEFAKGTDMLALRDHIEVKLFKIIYELIDYVKEKMKAATPVSKVEAITGSAKIIRPFSKNKDKQVIGGKVEEGEIKSGSTVKIFRRDALLGEGKIKEIQSQKIKTNSVKEGDDFGLMIESKIEITQGDVLKAVSLIEQ
jgi:translation initiation factor IF-2